MPSSEAVLETSDHLITSSLKPRRADSRKGENGVVAVVGGSHLYHGAPTLASLAALRSGVDLVYAAVPKAVATAVRAISPNLIVIPLPDSKFTSGCASRLLKWLPEVDAAVLGPGLGRQKTDGMKRFVSSLSASGVKLLLDADALMPDVVQLTRGRPAVITPHAGEFRRLFGIELSPSVEERVKAVKSVAQSTGITILLKGPMDIVSDGYKVAVNRTGTPAMTVGGTGDVLSGLVAGIMAKGVEPFEAASAGSYVNGLAGERAEASLGWHILATDVIEQIPYVMKRLEHRSSP